MGEYSLPGYASMISGAARVDAYVAAIRAAVKPGAIVVEIGTGLGTFAMLACEAGARRVYAIEPDDIVHVARELAAANGCADRIEFIQDISTQVHLPERADVVLSDLRGVLPYHRLHVPSIADARQRLLGPSGALIPQRDTVRAAIVEAPNSYNDRVTPWLHVDQGLEMNAASRYLANSMFKETFSSDQLLAPAQTVAVLDYAAIRDPNLDAQLQWCAERSGTLHGLCLWFDAELFHGIGFSNAPGPDALIYGRMFFPLSRPVPLVAGDLINLDIRANLVGDDYVWRWHTTVSAAARPTEAVASFRQSTFFSRPASPGGMRRIASDFRPRLSDDGEVDAHILQLFGGPDDLSIAEMAARVLTRFPNRFSDLNAAREKVGVLSQKYSR